jgi:hypothetical protein
MIRATRAACSTGSRKHFSPTSCLWISTTSHPASISGLVAALQRALEGASRERLRRETEAWTAASNQGDVAPLAAFLKDWPGGQYASMALAQLERLTRGPTRRKLMRGFLVGAAATIGLVIVVTAWAHVRQLRDRMARSRHTLRTLRKAPNTRDSNWSPRKRNRSLDAHARKFRILKTWPAETRRPGRGFL